MKQTLAPGVKAVQVVSQSPLAAAQKNKLKEAGGETFRFVTHQDKFCLKHHIDSNLYALGDPSSKTLLSKFLKSFRIVSFLNFNVFDIKSVTS